MNKTNQKMEFAANSLIIIVSLLLIGAFAQRYLFPSTPVQTERPQPKIGTKVKLNDVDFSTHSKTVVLVLQTSCRFCTESAAFYKRLLEETNNTNIKFVAVFPTNKEESTKHLLTLGLTGIEVKQASISSLDAAGTPTLILTNSKGEVEKFWVGKIPADKESEIINQIKS